MKTYIFMILLCAIFVSACDDTSGTRPWPKGHIPFILIGFNDAERGTIYSCMAQWEFTSAGKVKFIDKLIADDKSSNNTQTLTIIKSTDIESVTTSAGYDDNFPQIIFLSGNLEDYIVLHELGHALGLFHEHQRIDRDNYITVNRENIIPGNENKFSILPPQIYKLYNPIGYPYDYDSIMHFGRSEYGIHTIYAPQEIGKHSISLIDAKKIQDIYSEN